MWTMRSLSLLDITRHLRVVLIVVYVDPTGTVTPGGTCIFLSSLTKKQLQQLLRLPVLL